jgi:hypothetical protein
MAPHIPKLIDVQIQMTSKVLGGQKLLIVGGKSDFNVS